VVFLPGPGAAVRYAQPLARGNGGVAVGLDLPARLAIVPSVSLAVSRRSIPLSQCCLVPEHSPVP